MNGQDPDDVRPAWAVRMRAEREARGWSQPDAVRAMRAHYSDGTGKALPDEASLLRSWKRWEKGTYQPDGFYAPIVARMFGTVTAAIFPNPRGESAVITGAGMDTSEIISRLRASDVSSSTIEALAITTDRLCSEYPYLPSEQLYVEGRAWLQRITSLLDQRLTLPQHREVLTLAGWIALLVGCVEYDMGRRADAEATRKIAVSLGEDADNHDIGGWAQEMSAWFSLTQDNMRGVITAADAGQELAANRPVSVQLAAQRAKAWARLGDRRQLEVALDTGRSILEKLTAPTNLDNHFVVDPAKFDFYSMDCYRIIGEDRLAEIHANEVIRTSTDLDGTPRKPMRIAEAHVALGVVAARSGDLDRAVAEGALALQGERKSLPSLLLASNELANVLNSRYPREQQTKAYLDQLVTLTTSPAA